jgi:hypothetical protein
MASVLETTKRPGDFDQFVAGKAGRCIHYSLADSFLSASAKSGIKYFWRLGERSASVEHLLAVLDYADEKRHSHEHSPCTDFVLGRFTSAYGRSAGADFETVVGLVATILSSKAPSMTVVFRTVESQFDKAKEYFERNKEALALKYEGKYVAILNSQVVDSDSDFSALAERVYKKHGYISIYMPFVAKKTQIRRFVSHKRRPVKSDVS